MSKDSHVTIQMVVHNGARWVRPILESVRRQTWSDIDIILLDSASADETPQIIQNEYPEIMYLRRDSNIGIWRGMEQLLQENDSPYVLVLTDVILDPSFIERGVRALQERPQAGAVQAKILRGITRPDGTIEKTTTIDTVGFTVSRGYHITNAGHGEVDRGQYDHQTRVFLTEGAAPLFRRQALEESRIEGFLIDPDYMVGGVGYGDDVDVAWRLRLFGYDHIFVSDMIGWHDRSTTTDKAARPVIDHVSRAARRRAIPLAKRRLDWSNVRFTIMKNAFATNLARYLPWILVREVAVLGYMALFEQKVFLEFGRIVRLLPRMLRWRRQIMRRTQVSAKFMRQFFVSV